MASNNLAEGAQALLDAGADPTSAHAKTAGTPLSVAERSRASDVVKVLKNFGDKRAVVRVESIRIFAAGGPPTKRERFDVLEGVYQAKDGTKKIPKGFALVCEKQGWDTQAMWKRLNGGEGLVWFKHEKN